MNNLFTISFHLHSVNHFATFVYANVLYKRRHSLWAYLVNFAAFVLDPWSVVGDLNTVLGAQEKLGLSPGWISYVEFAIAIDDSILQFVDTYGYFSLALGMVPSLLLTVSWI